MLVTDLCFCYAVGFAGMQNERVMDSWRLPPRFHRKAWETRQCEAGSESLQAVPDRVMCRVLRVKLKLQWKPQKIQNAKNMEHLPTEASGSMCSQPERLACGLKPAKLLRQGCSSPWELTSTTMYPDARHGPVDFDACLTGFQHCFVQIPLFIHFEQVYLLCVSGSWKYVT